MPPSSPSLNFLRRGVAWLFVSLRLSAARRGEGAGVAGGVGENESRGVGGYEGGAAAHVREQMVHVGALHLAHRRTCPDLTFRQRWHDVQVRTFRTRSSCPEASEDSVEECGGTSVRSAWDALGARRRRFVGGSFAIRAEAEGVEDGEQGIRWTRGIGTKRRMYKRVGSVREETRLWREKPYINSLYAEGESNPCRLLGRQT